MVTSIYLSSIRETDCEVAVYCEATGRTVETTAELT